MTRRVLIVDDNAELAENLRELLELEGFEALAFTSPLAALEQNERLTFDAALLDIRMPGIDGIELCAALAKVHPDATFVLMTAFTAEQRLEDVRGTGAKAVLKKPLPVDRLLSLLGAVDARSVLLVEDDPDLGENLAEVLSPHGYRVVIATSLAAARRAAAAERPDLAVIDVRLPDGSGTELGRELIAAGSTAVVLITGVDEPEVKDSVTMLRARGARYLAKPFSPSALVDLLTQLPSRGAGP
jgi:DNA-binding response OmpR family regulator